MQRDKRQSPLRRAWARRRWFYAAYMVVAVLRMPMHVRFHLSSPQCDTALTASNAALSMTKVPHIVLFGIFFLFTLIQFDRFNWRSVSWSVLATALLGLLVELEETATRTRNCRLTDVLPDIVGAVGMALLVAFVLWLIRSLRRPQPIRAEP